MLHMGASLLADKGWYLGVVYPKNKRVSNGFFIEGIYGSWFTVNVFVLADHPVYADALPCFRIFLKVKGPAVLLADASRPDPRIPLNTFPRRGPPMWPLLSSSL
jgi:hypothetical protein